MRQLFAAEVANGTAPNDAAANALRRAQTEQLAAAAAERRRAAEAAAAAEAADASGAAAAAPPLERQPSVAAEGDTSFVRWEEVEQARHLVITHVHRAEGGAGASGRLLPHLLTWHLPYYREGADLCTAHSSFAYTLPAHYIRV